jgi:hypothetical protein
MSLQEYIDYISRYGMHVSHKWGDDYIRKITHESRNYSSLQYYPFKTSQGEELFMEFEINGIKSTIEDCLALINCHLRDVKINTIINELTEEETPS